MHVELKSLNVFVVSLEHILENGHAEDVDQLDLFGWFNVSTIEIDNFVGALRFVDG